jgi:O26-antigen biosynthesis N-acetyl-L-fucosamine transferase
MRILLIVDCYYPGTKSSARLMHDLGMELHRQGNEVIVLTPTEAIADNFELSIEDDLLVARVKTGQIKGAGRVLRCYREATLSATMWQKGKSFFQKHPCDLIIYYSPSIFFGSLVRKLKALWGCPAYLILRDIFPQWAVDMGILRKGLIHRFFRTKELEQYAAADLIGVQSPANLEYFNRELSGHPYKLEVLYNWATLDSVTARHSDYRARLGLQDKVVFFYGGNIGVAQDMDNILRLARSVRPNPRFFFLLVGDGSEVERLKAITAAEQLNNIKLLPAVEQTEYQTMLAEFDVGLVSLDRRLKTQNYPGKILGYMQCSMPILGSLNRGNDLRDLLERHEAGLCCLNGNDELLRAAALRLANDAALRHRLGQNARRLLERYFTVTSTARQILAHFQPRLIPQYADAARASIPVRVTTGSYALR